jgi:hypothetical protein
MENLQSHLDFLRDQFDTTCTELSEATRQTEKLRGEFEELRVKYESCSSELFTAKEDVFRLEVEVEQIDGVVSWLNVITRGSLFFNTKLLTASYTNPRKRFISFTASLRLQAPWCCCQLAACPRSLPNSLTKIRL